MTVWSCPLCGAVTHNPKDAAEHYCPACHVFTDDVIGCSPAIRCLMGTCIRRLAERATTEEGRLGLLKSAEVWEEAARYST